MGLKKQANGRNLENKGSHKFETSKENLVGFWFEGVEGEALSLLLKEKEANASTESPYVKCIKSI
ncbi:MAG: hypothetical protein J7K73_03540 [Nanoarchaeota archaeon]|nr:hypothetical protein [Nanoarchaeota archaeon]